MTIERVFAWLAALAVIALWALAVWFCVKLARGLL